MLALEHCYPSWDFLAVPPKTNRRLSRAGDPIVRRDKLQRGGPEYQAARKSRAYRVSAVSPSAQSSTVIDSSGLWLTPPLQRTNSMPAGQSLPITIVSWPAPDGNRRGGTPTAST